MTEPGLSPRLISHTRRVIGFDLRAVVAVVRTNLLDRPNVSAAAALVFLRGRLGERPHGAQLEDPRSSIRLLVHRAPSRLSVAPVLVVTSVRDRGMRHQHLGVRSGYEN